MKSSTEDETKGKYHKVKGEVKETLGQLTDDTDLEAEGKAERTEGKVKEKKGQIKKVLGK